MSRILKGNYGLKAAKTGKRKKAKSSITELFEHKAFDKLGGSIAFVMKSDKFLWSGDEKTK